MSLVSKCLYVLYLRIGPPQNPPIVKIIDFNTNSFSVNIETGITSEKVYYYISYSIYNSQIVKFETKMSICISFFIIEH